MKRNLLISLLGALLFMCFAQIMKREHELKITFQEAHYLGLQIWKNECAGKKEGLTCWNEGEEFASLGIGHFIWHPTGQNSLFKETFPELLKFAEQLGIKPPQWLKEAKGCPWKTRLEFQKAQQDARMVELRNWLFDHVEMQTKFMVHRLQKTLPAIIQKLPPQQQKKISFQFYRLARSPSGLYALIDYLNFKGAGTSTRECYQGQGWGLLQVLEKMQGSSIGIEAVQEFVTIAKELLDRRIKNAPAARHEERWRLGWFNRLDSYLSFLQV